MTYSFDKEAASLDAIRKRIDAEWRRIERQERDMIRSGDVDGARLMRGRIDDIMRPLYEQRDYFIERMPPFTVWDDQAECLRRHPVTPENSHLFK